MKALLLLLLLPLHLWAQPFSKEEVSRWKKQAQQVSIIRDNWGIPHVYGKTDADAVFGLIYAQCEDDFPRVERNYIEKLGRLAEVKGKTALYADLLIRLLIDTAEAKLDYTKAEPWLKKLLEAWAGGINYFLYKHPAIKPALLDRFEPWYPLLWTDGSIGAISTAGLTEKDLAEMYPVNAVNKEVIRSDAGLLPEEKFTGSNGFAFSPKITASGNAMLYINPHVTFYFRPEVHMVSEKASPDDPVGRGLNVYGAVTWGQFFIYQGFNEHCGWMHTSSAVDVADQYAETILPDGTHWAYQYENENRPVLEKPITLYYKGLLKRDSATVLTYYTHHGPVMAKRGDKWISLRSNNRSLNGLLQSWLRTKAASFADYKKTMELRSNTSNNTVYADAEGNIAYWHGNFIPQRDPQFDWNQPVDGSVKATEWKGVHRIDQTVHVYNPANGWLQNCNSTPFTVAGGNSPKKTDYPVYMAPDGENFRGVNAVRVLGKEKRYTLDKVIAAGYDNYLTAFEKLVPSLCAAFDKMMADSPAVYKDLAGPVEALRKWDYRCDVNSIPTTLAVEWGDRLSAAINRYSKKGATENNDPVSLTERFCAGAGPGEKLLPFRAAVKFLEKNWRSWQVPWGEVNRYQRVSNAIDQPYDDAKPSIPVGYASSAWGMLPSYISAYSPGTKKRYGLHGNSFICAVEFGKRIKAKSLLAGGESGNPVSTHFSDQMEMYSRGIFKDVLFYKEDVLKHVEKQYHPGE